MSLEVQAYYAVVKALHASKKDMLELELLLQELEKALGISPDLATTQMELAAQDAQAEMLHQYDVHGRHLVTGGSVELNLAAAYRPTAEHRAAPTASLQQLATVMPMSPDTSLYSQPAGKKQKKAGSTMGPPHTTQRGVATVSKASGANSGGTSKLKTKSAPSTPQGLASQVLLPQTRLGPVLGISPASFHQVMQRGLQPEMESYMAELNTREREIFTELIRLGTSEMDPDLNECHRALLQWYKLDARQAAIEQQLVNAM
ncbi:hypothetical protein V8C86DRAFT_2829193 [Haematococcus lacustris]